MERFRSRRTQLDAVGFAHPQADVAEDEIDTAVAEARRRLADMASSRLGIRVVDVTAGDPYGQLVTALR